MTANGQFEDALQKIGTVAKLLEDAMSITEETAIPTSCRFLDGMKWSGEEHWHTFDNHPDAPKERGLFLHSDLNEGYYMCYLIHPSHYYRTLQGDDFAPLRTHPEFEALCNRVKALVVTKEE